ncbi:hypothetical protein DFH09DRAFT_1334054 [Mycena vulgaris]|nr:hypothetical protein DFH09DRAFT_1334054 [Mycena vulgaris]
MSRGLGGARWCLVTGLAWAIDEQGQARGGSDAGEGDDAAGLDPINIAHRGLCGPSLPSMRVAKRQAGCPLHPSPPPTPGYGIDKHHENVTSPPFLPFLSTFYSPTSCIYAASSLHPSMHGDTSRAPLSGVGFEALALVRARSRRRQLLLHRLRKHRCSGTPSLHAERKPHLGSSPALQLSLYLIVKTPSFRHPRAISSIAPATLARTPSPCLPPSAPAAFVVTAIVFSACTVSFAGRARTMPSAAFKRDVPVAGHLGRAQRVVSRSSAMLYFAGGLRPGLFTLGNKYLFY